MSTGQSQPKGPPRRALALATGLTALVLAGGAAVGGLVHSRTSPTAPPVAQVAQAPAPPAIPLAEQDD